MEYWSELLHYPPTQTEIIMMICVLVIFSFSHRPVKYLHSVGAAFICFLFLHAAFPHLNDNGMFSFQDFGTSLFETTLGFFLSRGLTILAGIYIFRKVSNRLMPKKLFFKN